MPVDPVKAQPVGFSINRFDELAAGARAAHRRIDKKIFEIEIAVCRPGRSDWMSGSGGLEATVAARKYGWRFYVLLRHLKLQVRGLAIYWLERPEIVA